MEHLKYPIGKFEPKPQYQLEELLEEVVKIQSFPNELAKLLNGITATDLDKTYREGGWNVRQLIHHLADSHMNGFIRTKLALTEDNPTIKPYMESKWAAMNDYGYTHEASYVILIGLHQRWSLLMLEILKSPELLFRTYFHPEKNRNVTLAEQIASYAWHGRHHLEHIRLALGNKA